MVTSVIVSNGEGEAELGIAPDASIEMYQMVSGENGLAALDFILAERSSIVDVINMSWVTPTVYEEQCPRSDWPAMHDVLHALDDRGIVLVMATGNDSIGRTGMPACFGPGLTVGGTENANPTIYRRSNLTADTDVTAPAESISTIGLNGRIAGRGGTSFASPLVAACAALVMQSGVESVGDVEARLESGNQTTTAFGHTVPWVTCGPECQGSVANVLLGAGDSPTAGDDVIIGTVGNDRIDALEGDDVICGLGGDDYLLGGDGDDVIAGGDGADRLFGGKGADVMYGGDGNDVLHGNRGADSLWGQRGDDRLFGYSQDDDLHGGDGSDNLHGNAGNDVVEGNEGDDKLFGYADDDSLIGGDGDDLVVGTSAMTGSPATTGTTSCAAATAKTSSRAMRATTSSRATAVTTFYLAEPATTHSMAASATTSAKATPASTPPPAANAAPSRNTLLAPLARPSSDPSTPTPPRSSSLAAEDSARSARPTFVGPFNTHTTPQLVPRR